jgi:hypothetical protein
MHLNLWKLEGNPAGTQEVVISDFTFVPAGGVTAVGDDLAGRVPAAASGELLGAAPNPFNPRTTIRFSLATDQTVELAVHDLTGRRVRTLVQGHRAAGDHAVLWDGLDDQGRAVASGVYLVQLRGESFVDSRRATLVR